MLALYTFYAIVCCRNSYRGFRLPLMRFVDGNFEWRDPEGVVFQELALEDVNTCRMEDGLDLRIGLRSGDEKAISLKPVDEGVRPLIIAALHGATRTRPLAADPA